MAIPFGEKREDSVRPHRAKCSSVNKHCDQYDGESEIPSNGKGKDVEGVTRDKKSEETSTKNLNFAEQDSASQDEPSQNCYNRASDIYCISNSSNFNCGPTFINVVNGCVPEKMNCGTSSSKQDGSSGRPIKVRKGVFESKRIISDDDIQVVSQYIGDDWKTLVKNLPGITSYSSVFHQSLIDALDSHADVNLAELALLKWKEMLPQVSTIGNLAKILFSVDHPDVVTILNP